MDRCFRRTPRSHRVAWPWIAGCVLALGVLPSTEAQGLDPALLEPGCRAAANQEGWNRYQVVLEANATCGGPVENPGGVFLFSGEFVHRAVDLRIPGRGFDFVWTRTYRSRIGPNVGMGMGWDHGYDIRLVRITAGPSEARDLRFTTQSVLEWTPPADPAGAISELTYCPFRSTDPSDFSSTATTTILATEQPGTTVTDSDPVAPGQLVSYLILPKNGNRAGSLGVGSGGPRVGPECGVTGPDLILHDGSGRQDVYTLEANGKWTAPEFFDELLAITPDTFRRILPDTGTWDFHPLDGSPTAGRIAGMTDRNQNTMAFGYDTQGRLDAITDTLGRIIAIGYNAEGFLSTLTDFSGRQVSYGYCPLGGGPGCTFGDLVSVTAPAVTGTPNGNDFPLGKTTTYAYTTGNTDPVLNHNLVSITDPKGQTYLQNTYAPTPNEQDTEYDHVVEQTWGDPGEAITYAYLPVTPSPSNNFATVRTIENDRVGNIREHFYDAGNRLVMTHEYTGRAPDPGLPTTAATNRPVNPLRPLFDPVLFETRWEYDADSRNTRVVLPNLNERILTYDPAHPERRAQGNLRSACELPGPLGGTPAQICETFEYDDGPAGTNLVTRHEDGRGNPTVFTRDTAGNLLQTTHRIPTILENFEYNAFGQMTAHTHPDNGSGHRRRDEYAYHATGPQTGYLQQRVVDPLGLALTTTFEYDAVGNLIREIDPKGHDALYDVNQLDQVVRITSREVTVGSGIRYERDFFYDANDNVVQIDIRNLDDAGVLDPANPEFTTSYDYDILNFVTRETREVDPSHDVVTEYAYDANRNRTLVRLGEATNGNQPGNVVRTLFDERDLPFQQIFAPASTDQSTTQVDYDANGNTTVVRQGLEGTPRVTTTAFDGYDRPFSATDPMGNVALSTYDENHNRVELVVEGELTDVAGSAANVRLFELDDTFDPMDRLTRRDTAHFDAAQSPIGDGLATTLLTYADASMILTVTDDNAHVTIHGYDRAHRLQRSTDAKLNSITYGYDANGNVTSLEELDRSDLGAGDRTLTTLVDYDDLDRRIGITDNAGNQTQFGLDSRGNVVRVTDPRLNVTTVDHDGLNRRLSTTRDLTDTGLGTGILIGQIVTTLEWDDSDRLVAATDGNGNRTEWTYDLLNRRTTTLHADSTTRTSTYDIHHNLVSVTDPNGSTSTRTHDLNNRVTQVSVSPLGPNVIGTTLETHDWDGLSRLTLAEDDDSRVTRVYDSLGRVTSETQQELPAGTIGTVGATYDGVGNLKELVYPGGRSVLYSYDDIDRVSLIEDGPAGSAAMLAEIRMIGPWSLERLDLANGTRFEPDYDNIRRITGTTHSVVSPFALIDQRTYTWDASSNKTLADDLLLGTATTYTHDSVGRMRTSQVGLSAPVEYNVDDASNRTSVVNGPDPGPYTADPTLPVPGDAQMNHYTTTPYDARLYDENGNMTETSTATGPLQLYAFDYRDQLNEARDFGMPPSITSYAFDALGRRITKSDGVGTTRFFYLGRRVIEEQDALGATEATYVLNRESGTVTFGDGAHGRRPPRSGPVGRVQMVRGGQEFYYHCDDLASPRKLTDALGNVVEGYDYEDYGRPLFPSLVGNPYIFRGLRYDRETGFGLAESGPAALEVTDPGGPSEVRLGAFTYLQRVSPLDPEGGTWSGGTSVDLRAGRGFSPLERMDSGGMPNAYEIWGSNPTTRSSEWEHFRILSSSHPDWANPGMDDLTPKLQLTSWRDGVLTSGDWAVLQSARTRHRMFAVIDRSVARSRGFGFVTFEYEGSELAPFPLAPLEGRPIKVNQAREKKCDSRSSCWIRASRTPGRASGAGETLDLAHMGFLEDTSSPAKRSLSWIVQQAPKIKIPGLPDIVIAPGTGIAGWGIPYVTSESTEDVTRGSKTVKILKRK